MQSQVPYQVIFGTGGNLEHFGRQMIVPRNSGHDMEDSVTVDLRLCRGVAQRLNQ